MVFRFRMLSDENDNFVRDYEVLYDTTLLDFHNFILRSLEYEDCMASFFTADDRWEKPSEFTFMDMGDGRENAPVAMEKVTLGQIIHDRRDRLIYLFDLFRRPGLLLGADRSLRSRQGSLPTRVRFTRGPKLPTSTTLRRTVWTTRARIFGEMMSDSNDFEGGRQLRRCLLNDCW